MDTTELKTQASGLIKAETEKSSSWNENSTQLLIFNRLKMNDQFNDAHTLWDKKLLWTLILNQLLTQGYYFTIFDLIRQWEFQYGIYKDKLKELSCSENEISDWPYFYAMHSVFAVSSNSNILDSATRSLPSTSNICATPFQLLPDHDVAENNVPISTESTSNKAPYTHILETSTPTQLASSSINETTLISKDGSALTNFQATPDVPSESAIIYSPVVQHVKNLLSPSDAMPESYVPVLPVNGSLVKMSSNNQIEPLLKENVKFNVSDSSNNVVNDDIGVAEASPNITTTELNSVFMTKHLDLTNGVVSTQPTLTSNVVAKDTVKINDDSDVYCASCCCFPTTCTETNNVCCDAVDDSGYCFGDGGEYGDCGDCGDC